MSTRVMTAHVPTELAEKVDRTLSTLEGLERYEGHLFNWYDSTSLSLLNPRYPIGRVAALLGYTNQGAFTTWFQKRFHMTPRDWRSRHRK